MMDIENLIRDNIKKLKAYSSARGDNTEGILLDANENSFGSPIETRDNLNLYPDPNQKIVRQKLGDYLKIKPENLILGVGSDEILDLIIRIFCNSKEDNVIINEPTYGMYKVICDVNDVEARRVNLKNNFQLDLNKIKETIDEKTKIIFICSPNNPTGNIINKTDIIDLANTTNTIVVIDEAYIEFCEDESIITEVNNYENIIVTRTFSKAWGLAGVRCGYCVANKKVIDTMMKVKAPYNLSALTIEAVIKSIKNSDKMKILLQKILDERNEMMTFLRSFDFIVNVFESNTNFVLIKVKDAQGLLQYLKAFNIIIRDRCTQVKLENCVRITIGNKVQNRILIQKLRDYDEKYISV